MKNIILGSSAVLVVLATIVGLIGVLGSGGPEVLAKSLGAGGILGLGSIGLFFVGLIAPRTTITISSGDDKRTEVVTKVI